MDGTLLDEEKQLPAQLPALLEEIYRRDITFAVASGRSHMMLTNLFGELAEEIIFICDNGACVMYPHEAPLLHSLPKDVIHRILDACRSLSAGVPVLCAMTMLEDNTLCPFVGQNDTDAGEMEMQWIADQLGGKGNIAILTGPSSTTDTTARLEGYRNILANYPDMTEVIAPADCAWDPAKAQSTVESWLSAYDLDAIVCQNDGMAVGAGNAAGANSGIVITGLDGTPDGYEAIAE